MQSRGLSVDEDTVVSEMNFKLVTVATRVDPLKHFHEYFRQALQNLSKDLFSEAVKEKQLHRQQIKNLEPNDYNAEDEWASLLRYDEYDPIAESGCPYADELRLWLDCDRNANEAFASRRERNQWRKVKLPRIRQHLENVYGL